MDLDGATVTFYGSVGLPPELEEVALRVSELMSDCFVDGESSLDDVARHVVTELCIAGYVITKAEP